MTNRVDVLIRLLIGALTDIEAAQALDMSIDELQRLKTQVIGDEVTMVPIAVDLRSQRFEFLDLKSATFREPFFDDTVSKLRGENPNLLNFDLTFEDFLRGAEFHKSSPDGFIFHVGRCGSTLLSNMLAASGAHLVIKEPDLVNELLAGWLNSRLGSGQQMIETLLMPATNWLLSGASKVRQVQATRYRILKLAAWNIRLGKLLLDTFPSTPAVFIYRSAAETVASLLFQRPGWFDLIECPRSTQARFFPTVFDIPDELALSPVTFFAHAWRSAADAALALPPKRVLIVPYERLITDTDTVLRSVLLHFGHPVDHALTEVMANTRNTYAKDPTHRVPFEPKGKHSRPSLSPEQADEVRSITADHWHRLGAQTLSDP